jgi:hypothetical protein
MKEVGLQYLQLILLSAKSITSDVLIVQNQPIRKSTTKISTNYNHYDPTGEVTQRRSARLQQQVHSPISSNHPNTSSTLTSRKENGGQTK